MDEKSSGAPGVIDPSRSVVSTYIKPQGRKPHDPAVKFEEYFYYAQKTRAEELTIEAPDLKWREIVLRKKTTTPTTGNEENGGHQSQNLAGKDFANASNRLEISDEEWTNASRAFRTASWGACECLLLVYSAPTLPAANSLDKASI